MGINLRNKQLVTRENDKINHLAPISDIQSSIWGLRNDKFDTDYRQSNHVRYQRKFCRKNLDLIYKGLNLLQQRVLQ